MIESVTQELNKKQPSDFHEAVLGHVKALVKMSRSKVAENFSKWDMHDQVFHGVRYPDVEDARQAQKGNPIKMVVPNTFAQVMTFTSFLFLLFNQNRTFFELIPTGDEDYADKQKDCELLLQRDIRQNEFNGILFQLLLDIGRFGPGIIENCWTKDIVHAYVPGTQTALQYNNVEVQSNPGSEWQEFVRFEGNLIRSVSPYRWFPDTRYPRSDFQRGEFCASEEEYSISQLRHMEESGEVAGIDHIQEFSEGLLNARGDKNASRFSFDIVTETKRVAGALWKPGESEGTVIVTKVQVKLVPSKFTIGENKKLGPEEYPILYHAWYANDNRLIRLEPAYYWHNRFGWSLGEFTPDMQHTVSFGLADLIYRLQDVITWHINTRITDVRRNLKGRFIVDPGGVDTSSLDGDGDIYLRSNVSKAGVDRWMKQLETRDVTQAHLSDADILGKIMQTVTGVNDNIMGQYNTGRRSAQEARTVLSGAAGRMKLHGFLIWEKALAPLGKQMLSNLRQSLPFEAFARTIGGASDPQDQQARYTAFQGTPEEIICGDDYFTFDSTLSSEKGFMAQSLQDLLSVILQSDPVAAAQLAQKVDPAKIVDEIQYLRGSGNIKRFKYTPDEQLQIAAEQERRQQAQEAANKPKIALSLAGKMTPAQEAAAANSALGINSKPGISQDGGEKVITDRMKPVTVLKPGSNGASK